MQLKGEFKDADWVRAEAKEALASAGDLDAKAASAFEAVSSDLAVNIDGLSRAIATLKNGVARSSLLQSDVGSAIRKVVRSSNRVPDDDRSTLLSFLFGGDRQGYAPQSGDITGILKQLKGRDVG